MTTREKIAESFGVSVEETFEIFKSMDLDRWLAGESIDSIDFAGSFDDGSSSTAYFVATSENGGQFCICSTATIWAEWSEDVAISLGVSWGEMSESLQTYAIK